MLIEHSKKGLVISVDMIENVKNLMHLGFKSQVIETQTCPMETNTNTAFSSYKLEFTTLCYHVIERVQNDANI